MSDNQTRQPPALWAAKISNGLCSFVGIQGSKSSGKDIALRTLEVWADEKKSTSVSVAEYLYSSEKAREMKVDTGGLMEGPVAYGIFQDQKEIAFIWIPLSFCKPRASGDVTPQIELSWKDKSAAHTLLPASKCTLDWLHAQVQAKLGLTLQRPEKRMDEFFCIAFP